MPIVGERLILMKDPDADLRVGVKLSVRETWRTLDSEARLDTEARGEGFQISVYSGGIGGIDYSGGGREPAEFAGSIDTAGSPADCGIRMRFKRRRNG